MDEKDREIIRLLQDGFPLTPEPFQVLGDKLWIDEMTVISRLARMSQTGTVRYIGAFFDSQKMGYVGTLAAMTVEPENIGKAAAVLNEIPQITHNYIRDGKPNMWFTLLAKDQQDLKSMVDEIKAKTGMTEILLFPSKRHFKVRTDLA